MNASAYAHKTSAPSTAPALRIGQRGDAFEREADRVADEVTSGSGSAAQWSLSGLSLAPPLHRKASGVAEMSHAPAIVHDVLRSGGVPLDRATRSYFEPRFGYDFSNVRLYAGARAAESAKAVDAIAYTVNNKIAVDGSRYAPHTWEGRRLLAHELTHVVQNSAAAPGHEPARITSSTTHATIRRFGSEEHKELGTEASGNAKSDIDIAIPPAPPDYLTFGEVVALAGDYFGSFEQMKTLAQTPDGRAKIRWTRWLAIDQYKNVPEPPLPDKDKKAIEDGYYKLASANVTHFSAGGTAKPTYEDNHTQALLMAFQAGSDAAQAASASGGGQYDLTAARTREAFAQHYLSDMFAGGHIRTERQAIKAWYTANMPNALAQFVHYMAKCMASYVALQEHIPENDWLVSYVEGQINDLGGSALQSFSLGDIVSLAWHNADNEGLNVISQADQSGNAGPHKWRAVGDEHLSQSPETRGMAVAAMKASLQELDQAAQMGNQVAGQPKTYTADSTEFQQVLTKLKPFAAEKFIPRADPAGGNQEMVWEWGFMNKAMYDAVDNTIKTTVVQKLTEKANSKSGITKDALLDFVGTLEIIGAHAIENATGVDARIKPAPHYGLYGEVPLQATP
jgi:hypothetical protein